jgi:hypothetical protein
MHKTCPGITLIELVLVMSMIALVSFPLVIGIRNMKMKQAMKYSVTNMVSDLRLIHGFAREEKDQAGWGIQYVDKNSYQIVSGNLPDIVATNSKDLETPVVFKQSFPLIWFVRGAGVMDSPISIILQSSDDIESTVEITKDGIINVL